MRSFVLIVSTTLLVCASLPKAISQMVTANKINPSQVSILIKEIKSGNTIASQFPKRSRTPASVVKVLTTYSALLELGTSFKWPTKLYFIGGFHGGVIKGDIAVKAFGDPTLTTRDLHRIAKRLRDLGIHKITGNMLLDHTFFATSDKVSSGFDHNKYSEYNAMPDAIMLNDHLSKIIIGIKNGKITATKAILADSYNIINRMQPATTTCKGKYAWPNVSITNSADRPNLIFTGTISIHCPSRTIYKLLTHPYESFFYAFKSALNQAGISFGGKMIMAQVPKTAKALITHRSKPLLQIIEKTNKKSNNLYARHIFLLLGAQQEGVPATEKKGSRAVRNMLLSRGIWDKKTIISNGCGLSRNSKITANALVDTLEDAYQRYGKRWLNTLSVAGKDGTTKRRFRHSVAKGRAWMKTGTLNNAKNIAGYVKGKSGKMYVMAVLYSGRERWKGSSLQNQIIEWLARH